MAKTSHHHLKAILAAGLGWLVPGAGHAIIGRPKRAIIIFITIGATFWAGMAMGGVMTCDLRYERWWAIAEMLTGVHGLVAWRRQANVYQAVDAELGSPQPGDIQARPTDRRMAADVYLARRGVALVYPVAAAARAYAGVAGLLNLLCMFDAGALVLMGVSGEPRSNERRKD